ncbi:Acyl-CoA synthetase member 2 mitochondrial [Branchiostoma belcheri]|nr:Acyl-CoA synthetase member 2 mitochondrial [Branchiostoma belcheri]
MSYLGKKERTSPRCCQVVITMHKISISTKHVMEPALSGEGQSLRYTDYLGTCWRIFCAKPRESPAFGGLDFPKFPSEVYRSTLVRFQQAKDQDPSEPKPDAMTKDSGELYLILEGCQHSLKLFRCEPHVPSINVSCLVGSRGSQPANFRVGQWVRAFYHIKMTVGCLEQEIQSPEGRLQYQRAPLGSAKSQIKWPAVYGKDGPVHLTQSYHHGLDTTRLLGVTIGQKLQQTVQEFPDREMLVFKRGNVRRTFQQFFEECDQLAAGLVALGLRKGDRVGIWAPNTLEWVLTQFATARAGLIMVSINPAYQVNELAFALKKVGCRAVISATAFKTQDYYKMLHQICPELERCKAGQLEAKKLPMLETIIMLGEEKFPGTFSFPEVMKMGDHAHRKTVLEMQDKLQFDDPINIQFTSGTTGRPKGATLTHHNIVNNQWFLGRRLGYHEMHHKLCMPVPLYHCFGMVMACMAAAVFGTTIVSPSPSFEPEPTLQAIQEERQIPYGTTENSPLTFLGYKSDSLETKCNTIGQPFPHVEVKIVDKNGEVTPVNEPGELCTRGHGTMHGYWGDPDKTAEVIGPDRWYRTGDVAVLDEQGYGWIVGRMQDLIIRGGENIYPREIEEFLHTHPKVEDVQVIGVPDERMVEEVCAWIKLKEGEILGEDDVKTFCKGQKNMADVASKKRTDKNTHDGL